MYHIGALPDEDAKPIDRKTVRRVVATFKPYKGKVAVVGVAIFITSVLGVVNPLLIKVDLRQGAVRQPARATAAASRARRCTCCTCSSG